jgi:hypothetical protein
VRGYRHDEVRIQGYVDPLQQRDGGYDSAGFQAGQRGLSHASPGGEFNLGQPQGLAALADGLADQESPAGLRVSLAVLLAAAALAGKIVISRVLCSHISHPRLRSCLSSSAGSCGTFTIR